MERKPRTQLAKFYLFPGEYFSHTRTNSWKINPFSAAICTVEKQPAGSEKWSGSSERIWRKATAVPARRRADPQKPRMAMLLDILHHGAAMLAACALLGAAFCDVRSYEIPDGFAITIIGAFCLAALGGDLLAALTALAVGVGVFAAGALMFARGWLGGGDVKLLAATALWVPPSLLAPFTVVVSLTGAVLGLAMLSPLRRRMPPPPATLVGETTGALRQPMPFAVAIAAGGLFALLTRLAR